MTASSAASRRATTLERDSEQDLITTGRAKYYPARRQATFDKLSSVFASGNKTRDDQPNHIRIDSSSRVTSREMWVRLCPAQVYEIGREDAGRVR